MGILPHTKFCSVSVMPLLTKVVPNKSLSSLNLSLMCFFSKFLSMALYVVGLQLQISFRSSVVMKVMNAFFFLLRNCLYLKWHNMLSSML